MQNNYREVGIGLIPENNAATSVDPLVITQDFGDRIHFGIPWLLEVVFQDADAANFYDRDEGRGSVNVQISGTGGTFIITTMAAGGYQLQVPAGRYTVTFTDSVSPIAKPKTVGMPNVEADTNTAVDPPSDLTAPIAAAGSLANLTSGSGTTYDFTVAYSDNIASTAALGATLGSFAVNIAGGGGTTIRGTSVADTLKGGTGNDTLDGGAGSDKLLGPTTATSCWGSESEPQARIPSSSPS